MEFEVRVLSVEYEVCRSVFPWFYLVPMTPLLVVPMVIQPGGSRDIIWGNHDGPCRCGHTLEISDRHAVCPVLVFIKCNKIKTKIGLVLE